MSGWTTLVQPETLSIALGRRDLAIVDCRFSLANPLAGESAYREAHVPGAVFAHLDRDLSDHSKHGEGRHPWPDAEVFTAKLAGWGISPHHQVVAYDDGDGAMAARFWFLLRMLGHEKWRCWMAAGQPGSRWACRSIRRRRHRCGSDTKRSSTTRACSMRRRSRNGSPPAIC
jgi:thiosulfate/3-mercaptopyruvate sulfurtransferase